MNNSIEKQNKKKKWINLQLLDLLNHDVLQEARTYCYLIRL